MHSLPRGLIQREQAQTAPASPFLFCFSQLAEQKNLQLHARNGLFRLIIVLFQYVKSKKQLVSKTFVDFLSGSGILVHCPYIQALHCRQNAARFAGKSPRSRPETNARKGFCGMHQAKCTRKKTPSRKQHDTFFTACAAKMKNSCQGSKNWLLLSHSLIYMGLFGKSEITHKGVLENNFISPKMAQNDIAQTTWR